MVNNGKSKHYHIRIVEHIYNKIPYFTDIFTEETFYITVFCFIAITISTVFILSRFVTIKPVE
ncbi:uncharacterized protein [Onthophagus taurus]|uniref:uncharacterized protein n=1 Tax=Onthophagus taurus TaxID=166361 RepID=UPI000C205FB5|nr:uncharacterized protein LOC111417644 [Onthophagus taurus]